MSPSDSIIRTYLIAGILMTASQLGTTVLGEVPASIAPRAQSEAVEQIIRQLEAKAALAQGTWSIRCGPQDAPSVPWDCGISGQQWLLRSTAPAATTSLFFDGENGYQLPQAVHFQMDGALYGEMMDLRLGRYLLYATWSPRLFLGTLANVKTEPVTINGVNYIRLTADPRYDEVAKKDAPLYYKRLQLPILELLYDPQKKAFTSIRHDDRRLRTFVTTVDGWDNFGTAETWPRKLTVRTISSIPPATGTEPEDTAKPVLVEVQKFTPGNDTFFTTIRTAVQNEPYFVALNGNFRSLENLQKQEKLQPDNLTVQVELAQVQFLMSDMLAGAQRWNAIDAKLTDPERRARLTRTLAVPAAAALRFRSGRGETLVESTALLEKLTTTLPDQQFTEASYYITKTWQHLRVNPKSPESAKTLLPKVLQRLVKSGKDDAVELLLKDAASDPKAAALIDPLLIVVAGEQLPASGYSNSRLSLMVNSALRAGDVAHAQAFLSKANWPSAAPDSARQDAALVMQAAVATVALEKGQIEAIAGVPNLNQQLTERFKGKDAQAYRDIGKALVQASAKAITSALERNEAQTKVVPVLNAMPVKIECSTFWDSTMRAWLLSHVSASESTIRKLGPLVTTYRQHFNDAEYECNFWMTAWSTSREAVLGDRIRYLNKALAAAPTELRRAEAVRKLIRECFKETEYDLALKIAEGTAGMIQDPAMAAEIKVLTDSVKTAKAEARSKAVEQAKVVDKGAIENQLSITRSNLQKAESMGLTEDVKRWEQAVADLSKQLEPKP